MNDLRFALRMLWKNPGFTAMEVVTLALCIGDTLLLRPPPCPAEWRGSLRITGGFLVPDGFLEAPGKAVLGAIALPPEAHLVQLSDGFLRESPLLGSVPDSRLPSRQPEIRRGYIATWDEICLVLPFVSQELFEPSGNNIPGPGLDREIEPKILELLDLGTAESAPVKVPLEPALPGSQSETLWGNMHYFGVGLTCFLPERSCFCQSSGEAG